MLATHQSSINSGLGILTCGNQPIVLGTLPLLDLPAKDRAVELGGPVWVIRRYFEMNDSRHRNPPLNFLSRVLRPTSFAFRTARALRTRSFRISVWHSPQLGQPGRREA